MALRTNSDKRKFQRCHDINKVERIVSSTLVSLLFLLAVSVSLTDSSSMNKVSSLSSDEVRHQAVVKVVQKNLLSLFGMKKKPTSVDKSKAAIPKAMLDLYHQQRLHSGSPNLPLPGRHTRSANTIRSYIHLESKVDERFRSHHKFRLLFNVSNIPSVEKLTGAELKLTVEVPSRKPEEERRSQVSYRVSADDIVMPGSKSSATKPILRLIDSKEFRTNDNEVHLDVLPAVQRWLEHSKQNHGILLRVESVSGQRLNETGRLLRLRRSDPDADDVGDSSWKYIQPFLFLYTDDERYSSSGKTPAFAGGPRKKRSTSATASEEAAGGASVAGKKKISTGSTNKRRSREVCQRHPLYVDFERVGWNDWIVAPPGYEAYHCAGDCPFPLADHLNSTNHAIVQSLMHSMLPQQVPKACCVPTSLAPISMLYLDEENRAVLKNYQDMYVVGCGCR